jgi:HEAT repeat protein
MNATLSRPFRFALSALIAAALFPACGPRPTKENLLSDRADVRRVALEKTAKLSDARKAELVPELVAAFTDPDSVKANRATDALVVIGNIALPALRGECASADVFARLSAVNAIGRIKSSDPSALQALESALADQHPLVRQEAALGIGLLESRGKDAAPLLVERLKDTDPGVRDSAAEALEKIGAGEATEALRDAQEKRPPSRPAAKPAGKKPASPAKPSR